MGESMAWRYKSSEHRHYVFKHGDGILEIAGCRWGQGQQGGAQATPTEGDNL